MSEKPREAAAATLVISPLAPTAPSKPPLASNPDGAPPILTREAPSETTVSSAPTGGATLALPGMPAPEPARTTRPARQAAPQPSPEPSPAGAADDTPDFHDERPSRSTGPSAAEERSAPAPTEAYSLGEDARAVDATLAYTLGEDELSLDQGPSLGDEPEPARHEDTQAVMAAVGGGRRKRVAIGVVLVLVALSATAALVMQERRVSAPAGDAEAIGEEASGDGLAAAVPGSGDAPPEGSAEGSAVGDEEALAAAADAPEQPAADEGADASAQAAAEPPRQPAAAPRPARRAEPAGPPTDYDGQMSAANRALRAGRHDDALELFSAATETRPSSAEAFVGIARAYEGLGRQDLATIRYERATSINSRYTPAWLGLGDAKRRAGDIDGAIAAYERVLQVVRIGSSAERAREALEELRGGD